MDRWKLLSILFILSSSIKVECQEITSKFGVCNKNACSLQMDENNRAPFDPNFVLIEITDFKDNISINGDPPFSNDIFTVTTSEETHQIIAKNPFDYDNGDSSYTFTIIGGDLLVDVTFNIIDVDDETPEIIMVVESCELEENALYTAQNSPCEFTISDLDGSLSDITYEITDKNFELNFRHPPQNNKDSSIYLTIIDELDYEKRTLVVLDITPTDPGKNVGKSLRVRVNIKDMPDTNPVWSNAFEINTIIEKEEREFPLTARDGDVGYDDTIIYSVINQDTPDTVTIDPENGLLHIEPIDRDLNDLTDYKVEINACETNCTSCCTPLKITFFITDKNDCAPEIIQSVSTNQSLNKDNPDTLDLSIDENFNSKLDFKLTIQDRDQASNSQFSVKIVDVGANKASDVFQVIPDTGFRIGTFEISVFNNEFLDYEDPDWREIAFKVESVDNLDPKLKDEVLINISLMDLNDESPIFPDTPYSCEVPETVKQGVVISTVEATDADEGDIVTYSFYGSNANILQIDASGKISVAKDNAFDYDKNTEEIFNIRATDLIGNTATTTLTVTVTDVNNRAPTLEFSGSINTDENRIIGSDITDEVSIIASDVDTEAKLEAKIDWDSSYAVGLNGKESDIKDNPIYTFIDLNQESNANDKSIKISLIVNDKNPNETAPDYEVFHTLILYIIIDDTTTDPEFEDKKNITGQVSITINDINDNTPVISEIGLDKLNVFQAESDQTGTLVGKIIATDDDIDDELKYYMDYSTYNDLDTNEISSTDPKYDWIEMDESNGYLYVRANVVIDPDTNNIYNLTYICYATDTVKHKSEEKQISVHITDNNNNVPQISTDPDISVKEHTAVGAVVTEIHTTDLDRDEPYHTVVCEIDDGDCKTYFSIDPATNNFMVDKTVERDGDDGIESFDCKITCTDNPDKVNNKQQSATATFVVTVEDINDNQPKVVTTTITTKEDQIKDTTKNIITGSDLDSGKYGDLTFSLETIKRVDTHNQNNEHLDDLFNIEKKDSLNSYLVPKLDLKNYWGEYVINVKVTDCTGCSGDEKPTNANADISLKVEPFNYDAPAFIFPTPDDLIIQLDSYQQTGAPLKLYNQDLDLSDFNITDVKDTETCSGRWNVKFTVEEIDPTNENIFEFKDMNDCKGQLQINGNYNEDTHSKISFKIRVIATVKGGSPSDEEGPYSTSADLQISFIDDTEQPHFDEQTWETEMIEEDKDEKKPLEYPATYSLPNSTRLIVYKTSDNNFFDVACENTNCQIILKQKLDRETTKQHTFKLLASKDRGTPDPLVYQDVTVTVKDVNDNAPVFTLDNYNGAIVEGNKVNTPILKITASDVDDVSTDLTYDIASEITPSPSGTGIGNLGSKQFTISPTDGTIALNFEVLPVMAGFFTFDVMVKDQDVNDGWGQNNATTQVKIYIITKDNSIDFRFENTVEDVADKEEFIKATIGETLENHCYRQTITLENSGDTSTAITKATLYFMDTSDTSLLPSSDILKKVTTFEIYSKLKSLLLKESLLLQPFVSTDDPEDNTADILRAWLIGVGVVLGTLVLILAIVYFLERRSLKNRINNLTSKNFGSQESGLNRIGGVTAPNTNIHAAEGSNPVFNITEHIKGEDDGLSIDSYGSDLVGVEDNPEFDLSDRNNEIMF